MPGTSVIAAFSDFRFNRAVSASPLTTGTLFTWTGGIEIFRLTGLVTTIIQDQATTVKLSITPDAQTAVDICATKDARAFAAGSLLQITGTAADAMVGTTAVAVTAPGTQVGAITAMCVTSGTITVTYGAASTGAIRWDLVWRPLTETATVT